MFPYDESAMPWRPWSPQEANSRLAGMPVHWAVAGGWAIDLHLGRVTRTHHDLEICVPAAGAATVIAAFPEPQWRWYLPSAGHLQPIDAAALATSHQTWLWSVADEAFVLDVFREAHDGPTWIFRRDPTIRRPSAEMVERGQAGVPYLAPEVVLLFKAKGPRPQDVADLTAVLPALDGARRAWLRAALTRTYPGHEWLGVVGDPIVVHPCRAGDVAALATIFVRPGPRWERQQAGESVFLIAWLDGRPVGTGELRWRTDSPEIDADFPGCPELNGLDVEPAALRSHGVGTAILLAAEAAARSAGRSRIGLGVADANPRAAALYLRVGYRDTGHRYVDRYSWTDRKGVRHDEADPARFLTKPLV